MTNLEPKQYEKKPHWMKDHEASDLANFQDIRQSLQRIEVMLDPIFENYTTATRLGKWFMATATVASIIIGILLSLKALIGK